MIRKKFFFSVFDKIDYFYYFDYTYPITGALLLTKGGGLITPPAPCDNVEP